jgi:uncharacterized membrane protein
MLVLIAGLLLFLGVHSTRVFADAWRTQQIGRLGAGRWKVLYTVVSLIGFGLLVWGFGMARAQPVLLWAPPHWTHHVAALLVLVAFILVVAAYVPGTHIKAAVGHPMVLGVKVWAAAHLLANGTLADVLLFGSFLVWAIYTYAASRRRDRAAGTRYPAAGAGRDVLAVVIGVVAFGLFAAVGHRWLIGVDPFA